MRPESKPRNARKPYRAPVLQHFGNLARITNAVTNMGPLDGGTVKGMRRTQP